MARGKMCVLVGGQYGSEGKGAVAAHVADRYQVHVRVGSPNAGHTIWWNGFKHVMQTIPCGWINPSARIVIGRGALINMRLLMNELVHILQHYPDFLSRLYIDAEAGILDERFHEIEGGVDGEAHRRIGSTGEGVGPARIARLKRDPDEFRLFRDVAADYGLEGCMYWGTPFMIAGWQDAGEDVLIEGTQGSGLSLLHSFWPYCTTVDTNAAGIISEVGIAPSRVTDVLQVFRTYPIRVAGNSGPMEQEIEWRSLSEELGRQVSERTTVTHKLRRIAKWDPALAVRSLKLNEPTEIALTFCDYVDGDLMGQEDAEAVLGSEKMRRFLDMSGLPVERIRYLGTGPMTMAEVVE